MLQASGNFRLTVLEQDVSTVEELLRGCYHPPTHCNWKRILVKTERYMLLVIGVV